MSFQFKRSPTARATFRCIPVLARRSLQAVGTVLLLSLAAPALAQVSLTTLDTAYTQDFNTLPSTGSPVWTSNSTIPGWYSVRTGTGTTIVADTGSGTGGNLYSYGAASNSERALGSLGSGNAAAGSFFHGVRLANNTGATITSLDVAYVGEQWRSGGPTSLAQTVAFSYLVGSPTVTGSLAEFQSAGVAVTNLDFTSPITGVAAAALDGNAAANRSAKSFTITGLSIPNGTEVMLRWSDPDHSGTDHGLAIDDVSVTPHSVAAQPNLSINDVSVNEGDVGTTVATFTVSLSQPAGPGGVTFDIATADGTAGAGSDYVANSLTSQTIPAGSTTYSFNVTVNGDVVPEANETFFVNVTNVTGATVADGQGKGTITDNDAPHLSIADVSHSEGNGGTTSYVFTVSLTQPAGPGGVSFDIATADATATSPSDYTSQSLTGQTIAAGNSSATFTVLVNGDTTTEPDETFNVNVTNVVNASVDDAQAVGTIVNDDITITKIHDVQGNGAATPIPGQTVTVEGVVTAQFLGATKLSGFFLQEEDADADADPNTSEGIFVFCTTCTAGAAVEGQRVRVTGVVSEFFNMTELTPASPAGVVVTDAGNHLAEITPATVSLPVVGDIDTYYEAREAMLVTFADTLSISEFFELPRYGQIELLQGGRSRTFTEDNAPSVAGLTAHLDGLARRRVILDDDNNVQNSVLTQPDGQQAMYWPHQNGGFGVGTQGLDYFRGGDTISGLTGVLHWSFAGLTGTDAWRIRPTAAHPVAFTAVNTRPVAPPNVGGTIKVVGMNLLNYFTTIDTTSSSSSGPCGPSGGQDCRGADSNAELIRQRERASIVVCTLNPDVAGFMELENTTPSATITDLLGAVNTRCGGTHPYAFANTGGTLGTDAIRVQIVYRTGVVSPVGAPLVDLDPVHNRPPTAQTFDVVDAANPAFGKRFTVIANHFKSKGSCPTAGDPDADAGDGQGCWAVTRTAQANRLMSWINSTVIPAAGDPDVLLLGDFNSYAHETPVTTLAAGGYADMETVLHGTNAYSYQFDGELGHLDYAFANSSMQSQITGADAWHINADEVPSFDYNDEIRDTGEAAQEEKPDGSALVPPRVVFQPATPYRASDHDPVIVGLFAPVVTHTVTSSVGTPSGTITPPSATVNDGATTVFTLTADPGFHINTVGGTCPAGSLVGGTYTTGAIIADCTVIANFAANVVTHTVTAVVGTPSGTITPPSATVNDGATTAFTVTANPGFHITTVTGCGGSLAANTYTTGPITADCTVTANFAADTVTHTVTAVVGTPSGTITPPSATVNDGATTAFTVTADAGFHIDTVTGCGGSLAANTYTTGPITADCTVTANFAADGGGGALLTVDLSVANQITVSATTGVSAATISGPTSTGFYFQDFLASAGTLALGTTNIVGTATLTAASVAPDGTPALFRGASGADAGLNIWSYSAVTTTTFTSGQVAFAGTATWSLAPAVYTAMLTAPNSGNLYFPADDSTDIAGATLLGTYTVIHPGPNNPPAATVAPTSLSFTVAANATATQSLNIANAVGSDPLTYAIAAQSERPVLRPHVKSTMDPELAAKLLTQMPNMVESSFARSGPDTVAQNDAPWHPQGGSPVLFTYDDGTAENAIGLGTNGPPATEKEAVYIDRFTATGALTVDSVSVLWRTTGASIGQLIGKQPNIVVYYDAAATGDPSNAVRIGSDTLVTIVAENAFETYPVSFAIPGAGDVYVGYTDAWASGGAFQPRLFPGSIDTNSDAGNSWLSATTTGGVPTDVTTLANNNLTSLTGPAGFPSNWMIRATGVAGSSDCTGPVVPWLTATPASGSVNGGTNTNVSIEADPTAGSLAAGSYTAQLCITTNDPTQALIAIPVTLTVTEPAFVPCSGGADEIFCDGFDPAAAACVPAQLLQDTSFEASLDGSGPWASTSSNFGTALCDVAGCGNGGGTATPRTGDIWAWFGGIADAEIATASQAVTIPAGGTRFVNFFLWIGSAAGGGGNMDVKVDANVVASFPEPAGPEAAYTLRSVDVSAFADGASHTIAFDYDSAGTQSNYSVDDVTLDCAAGTPMQPRPAPPHTLRGPATNRLTH